MEALRRAVRVLVAGKVSLDRQDAALKDNADITRDLHDATAAAKKLAQQVREENAEPPVVHAR